MNPLPETEISIPPLPPASGDMLERGLQLTNLALIYAATSIAVYIGLLFFGRFLKRRFQVPLGWVYHLFCIAVALFTPSRFPGFDFPGEIHLGALLTFTGALVVIGFVRYYFFDLLFHKKNNSQVPKFLSEIVSIAILLGAVVFILDGVYGIPVPGLLAGAGIVGIVLGLALQDTLGNIFSGFAIYFGGQFRAGDWLLVDGRHAKIVEINWRSTRLVSTDAVCLDIPNSSITKQTVVNFNYPTSIHAIRMNIGLEYDAPPSLVEKVLIEAALDCPHVLKTPRPNVFVEEFANWSVTYQLRYWLDDHEHLGAAGSQIRKNLWYSLRRHKITIPYPIQTEYKLPAPAAPTENRDLIRSSLAKAVFADCLSSAQLEQIAAATRIVVFGKSENIIRLGDPAGSMYVLIGGRAEVWIDANGTLTAVATLGPGTCIGESSLLTGEPRSATICALEDCTAVEVDKATIAPLINANPELLESLSELLTQRRLTNEGVVADAASAANREIRNTYKAGFLQKLKSFFAV